MAQLPVFKHDDLLVSGSDFDDAGVFRLRDDLAIIQTLDFFTPVIDDPFLFGQIAAANALSDVYAMGGTPLTAMNIAAFPRCADIETFSLILQGGAQKIKEAGAFLLGGHTIEDKEPKYGLSVTGTVHPAHIVKNSGACAGDLLFLTKKLGVGVICTALKGGVLNEGEAAEVFREMAALNKAAALAMNQSGIRGATDVTGFGLLGHLHEMCAASRLGAEVWADALPVWPQAVELAKDGLIPAGAHRNRDFLREKTAFFGVPVHMQDIMLDPQTSGGLLLAVPPVKAGKLESDLELAGVEFAIIGKMKAGSGITAIDRR